MTGFDDLTASAPTTPDGADPGWRSNRARVLDDILAEQPQLGRRRWIAGLAAAAILVAAVAVGIQMSRPDQVAIPADPTTSAPAGPQLVGAAGTLLGAGEEIGLCRGALMESYPPQCETIPIEGLTWADVPWADGASGVSWGEATIVGTFDGTTFHASQVFAPDDPGAPSPEPGADPDGLTWPVPADSIPTAAPSDDASTDPPTTAAAEPTMTATGMLVDVDGSPALCAATVVYTNPPGCGGPTVPLTGLTWDDVAWRTTVGEQAWADGAVLIGRDDGTTFHVTDAYAEGEAGTPSPLNEHAPLCETPTDGTGDQAGAAGLEAIAKRYPGYVGLWVSPDQATFNLAFTDGGEEAAAALAAEGSEPFCVGRVDGITAAEAAAAMPALGEMMQSAGITYYGHTFGTPGSRLDVGVIRETPEVRRALESAIGPAAAEHLRIVALIHPTEG